MLEKGIIYLIDGKDKGILRGDRSSTLWHCGCVDYLRKGRREGWNKSIVVVSAEYNAAMRRLILEKW
jgi:hypothetical protein